MIQVTPQMRILLAVEPVDFRKGIDGLAGVCKSLQLDPFSGYLFVFRSRSGTSLKLLVYDSQGYWLCQKRLSKGRFRFWPKAGAPLHPLAADELQALLWNKDPGKASLWRPLKWFWTPKHLFCILSPMRYCGREFTGEEMDLIGRLIATGVNRQTLSRMFCEEVNWRKPDGGLKEMSCKVAFLRMHRDGHIILPPPLKPANNHLKKPKATLLACPQPEAVAKAGAYTLNLCIVDRTTSALWNDYIDRYHYLGYAPLPGAQLRYFIKSEDQILALLGFSAAAWKCAPRDDFIGWESETRKKNLHLVVNNARFLILPWVHSHNLASRILSMAAKRIASDWRTRYGYTPVLLETFVEKERFTGVCYRAANWVPVGDTKGRGKLDVHNEHKLPVKSVWLYPLRKDFKEWLSGLKSLRTR